MRLIDADSLFDKLDENSWYDNADRDIAEDLVLSAPTIVPESLRPRGHWESPSKLLNIVNCTACKTAFPGDFDEFRYCPNCGAKMEDEAMKPKQNNFRMELLSEIGSSFSVYQDMETGVQYIVFMKDDWFGITPRYNADGSLYQGGVAHE